MLNRIGTPHLLVSATYLACTGLVMVYSASALRAEVTFGSSMVYFWRQLMGLALGVGVAALVMHLPLAWIRRSSYLVWAVAIGALVATLSALGVEQNNARRWLDLGGFVFQPLEIAKLATVIAVARWLSDHQSELRDYRVAMGMPLLLAAIPAAILVLQPDFGGAVMLALFAATLTFVAGARLTHLAATALATLPGLALIAMQAGYRESRLRTFLDPWADPMHHGYQLVQSLLAFGAGGIAGTGLGAGQQKLGYLPEAHTDFILSVVGEEMGLLGVGALLICFAVLGLASIGIASRARDPFAALLATGASLLLWLQGLLNAGVAMGVLPTKGTTLPLFSYGRSSLVVSLAAMGLVLNVARPSKRGRKGWR